MAIDFGPPSQRLKALNRRSLLKGVTGGLGAVALPFGAGPAWAAGRPIKLGLVSPRTGPLAPFAAEDDFVIAQLKDAFDKGVTIGGQTYPVTVVVRDSQSSPKRAAEVAASLIDSDNVDLLLAAGTADTTNPTADQAEANGVPCITTDAPWEAYFFGRRGDPKKPFEWTYHFFWGLKQISDVYTGIWGLQPTNKVIGSLWSNDPDGSAIRKGVSEAVTARGGFKHVDTGLFTPGTDDFTSQISTFKAAGAEIVTGLFIPPDFSTFWSQCAQQGFKPKIATVAKALLFPSTVEALGERGAGLTNELWWSPYHPFKSGLTGASSADLCAAYTKATGAHWIPPLGFKHALFEVAIDVLGRSKALEPGAIRDAIRSTSYQSIAGKVDWSTGPVANVSETPLVGGQWVKTASGFDETVIYDQSAPEIPLNGKLVLLS